MAAGGDGIAHAFDAEDVGQLMRVPEDRRGALGEDNFRVALGRRWELSRWTWVSISPGDR
jgi:hypothetical protein